MIYIVFLDDFDVTYNDKNYSIEKEQLIRDEINKEHLTAHQNRINVAEVADSDKSEFSRIKTSSDFDGALWTGIRSLFHSLKNRAISYRSGEFILMRFRVSICETYE